MGKTTLQILEEYHLDYGIIHWQDDVIPPTHYWYEEKDNSIHADCGVTIPFVYDIKTQMARCRYDVIMRVIEHYEREGIILRSTDD